MLLHAPLERFVGVDHPRLLNLQKIQSLLGGGMIASPLDAVERPFAMAVAGQQVGKGLLAVWR